jgi:hypothetical protein
MQLRGRELGRALCDWRRRRAAAHRGGGTRAVPSSAAVANVVAALGVPHPNFVVGVALFAAAAGLLVLALGDESLAAATARVDHAMAAAAAAAAEAAAEAAAVGDGSLRRSSSSSAAEARVASAVVALPRAALATPPALSGERDAQSPGLGLHGDGDGGGDDASTLGGGPSLPPRSPGGTEPADAHARSVGFAPESPLRRRRMLGGAAAAPETAPRPPSAGGGFPQVTSS